MSQYHRTTEQKQGDWHRSKAFEAEVAKHLPQWHIDQTDSTTKLDWWIPGVFLDAKEKHQRLGERWHLLEGVDETDLFVIDELSVRKALEHGQAAYFLLRDIPGGDRLFIASAMELACVERARRNRVSKGKLIVDLRNFRQINNLAELVPTVMADLAGQVWRQSPCVGLIDPGQV